MLVAVQLAESFALSYPYFSRLVIARTARLVSDNQRADTFRIQAMRRPHVRAHPLPEVIARGYSRLSLLTLATIEVKSQTQSKQLISQVQGHVS